MLEKEFTGHYNPAFVQDESPEKQDIQNYGAMDIEEVSKSPPRETWGNGVEFLMSCIAMSVGLGNVWRFPFTAYENGGGAFLIPYIIVLILIGKPIYFMEMVLGQFSSKATVKVYDFVPALRGNGVGQIFAISCVMTYYTSLMAIILYYMIASFSYILPWSVCDESWNDCFTSGDSSNLTDGMKSSSELYFTRTVLREVQNIDEGIGTPNWKLTLCLLFAWISIFLVLFKGVKSSGKASYFMAMFPYVVICVLLIRACTLPGALGGILFFIKPNFNKILEPKVWYAAVTQCFFSLSVCFGNVIMYSSYNNFNRNIYKDTLIVTSLDTVTSLLAGFTIFGILGNLAETTGKDIEDVVRGGTGLAFISYPEAITKFDTVPQVFAVLFFLMLFVLGIGSCVAVASSIISVIRDRFHSVNHSHAVSAVAIFGFFFGLIYITPGGQFILNLVDHHGGGFIVYFLGIAQCLAVSWIYGLKNFCDDIEFMLKIKMSVYWRACWSFVTPGILLIILVYSLISLTPIEYKHVAYPISAIVCGWLLSAIGIVQLPLFAIFSFVKRRNLGFTQMFKSAFTPRDSWGPVDLKIKKEWIAFKEMKRLERSEVQRSTFKRFYDKLMGY